MAEESVDDLRRKIAAQEQDLRDLTQQLERAESTDEQLLAQQRRHTSTLQSVRAALDVSKISKIAC